MIPACSGTVEGGRGRSRPDGSGGGGGTNGGQDAAPGGGAGGGSGGGGAGAGGSADSGAKDALPPDAPGKPDGGAPGVPPDCEKLGYPLGCEGFKPCIEAVTKLGVLSRLAPETADEMYCYVGVIRGSYVDHGAVKGLYPDTSGATRTWPLPMAWDGGLAAAAQAEAERLAAGGKPKGKHMSGAGWETPPPIGFSVDGEFTADWMLSSDAEPLDAWSTLDEDVPMPAFNTSFGLARMMLYYHDFGGDGPVLTHLGTGMATKGKSRFWVLKLAP